MLKVFRDLELEFGRYPLPLEVSFVEKSDLIEAVLDVSWSFGSAQAAEKNSVNVVVFMELFGRPELACAVVDPRSMLDTPVLVRVVSLRWGLTASTF